ncbi:MAG: YeeE/YedE family protein [Lysobacterales bacterium]
MNADALHLALAGGLMVGAAAALLYWLNGRIAGVSGIFGDLFLERDDGHWPWRAAFLAGLLIGFVLIRSLHPELARIHLQSGPWALIVAGLLVGYGTRMSSGCTSGHGVCGIARISRRSLLATGSFMFAAMLTVALIRHSGLGR